MRALNNSEVPGFRAKQAELGSEEYSARVASAVMGAVDAMPRGYRALVNEFGYVDVYRAWRRGLPPDAIKARAADGMFRLPLVLT